MGWKPSVVHFTEAALLRLLTHRLTCSGPAQGYSVSQKQRGVTKGKAFNVSRRSSTYARLYSVQKTLLYCNILCIIAFPLAL